MTTTTEKPDPNVVTDERAQMLANHAIYVQGGFSDAAIERERAEKQLARSPGSIDWDVMQAEVTKAVADRIAALPVPAPDEAGDAPKHASGVTRADVTAVLANIDQGAALRDRITALKAELKIHEDAIKDMLGEAIEGVDARGNVVVRYPHRNRTTLIRKEVEKHLTPAQVTECEQTTSYRTLLYGE